MPAQKLSESLFYIPSIDIAPYIADPTSAESQAIIDDVRAACRSTGFFQLKNHGVPLALQKSVFQGAHKFFELPFDTKLALDCKKHIGHRGYDVLASQSYEPDVLPDLKEGFYAGQDFAPSDPRLGRFYVGPNVWPSEKLLRPEEFRQPMEQYFDAMIKLSHVVLDLIAATLPYGPHVFDKFRSNDPICPLRLLHYPPTPKDVEGQKRQLGSSAHTDFGAVTLLLQDGNPGLEVFDQNTNTWVPVPPETDSYVVNIGDMLSKWTDFEYKSSVHRVLNRNPGDRYSVVFFFDGNLDCELLPLDGSQNDQQTDNILTVEKHMIHRITSSYSAGKSTA